ncbi:MAG: YetF domain-containing protein [Bacillota bacterium]
MEDLASIFGSTQKLSSMGFIIRTLAVGVILYFASRYLPRRSGGQYSSYDFAFFWMMGGLVASPLFDSKISFASVLTAAGTIYALHYLISYIMVKSRTMARIIGGMAIPLVMGGKIMRQNMKKALFPLELLLSGIRQVDAPNLAEVEVAVLETNGSVSVLKKPNFQPVTQKDLKINTVEAGLPVLLINEGRVIKENLNKLGYTGRWLEGELKKYGILNVKDVYMAAIDGTGQLYYSVQTEV